MDCQNCNKRDIYTTQVPLVVLENTRAQMDAHAARLVRVIVLLVILFVGSNALWLWHESQYETIRVEQDNDRGFNNFIGNDGDIYNGETDDYLPQKEDR